MRALDRKLARDLWRIRGQVIAVALVIASGVAVLVMSLSTLEALEETTGVYYERYRFADVFANAVRAPERIAERVAEVPGVQFVETRIARYATLDIDSFAEPVIGRLTSIPERGQPDLNQLVLRSGRWIDPARDNEVILNEPFAEAHELMPGATFSAVMNGHRRTLTVVGTALSPEFVYSLGPGALMPDDLRFGVVWMGREGLAAAYDLEGAFNDLSVLLERGASAESALEQIDRLLEPYGGVSAMLRADQLSNWFLMNEIDQQKSMSTILPGIFLSVAAFLVYMVLTRLVATERSEVGLLKAFGYSGIEIAWHYTKLVIAMTAIGVALGWVLGAVVGRWNTGIYAEFYRFPLLIYRPSAASFGLAALASFAASLAGALGAVRRVAELPPAEAMQPPAPPAYRRGPLARLPIARWLDQPTRIALRQIGRSPIRSLMTSAGVALAVGLLVMALQWNDAIDAIADSYFYQGQRQSMMIGLSEPQGASAVHDFEHLPGVLSAEPLRIVGADFSVGTRAHRGALSGVAPGNHLQPIHDDATGEDIDVPPAGVLLGTRLAEKLGVRVGDEVSVDVLEGRRPSGLIPVVATFETQIAMPAYMSLDALNRLLEVRPSVEYVNLLVDRAAEPELFAKLKGLPKVSAIMLKQAAIDSFYDTIAEHMLIYIGIFTTFAAALGFGVAYNSARIALSERGRDLATLRVLGFTRGEVSYVLLGEVALLILLALPFGCLAGWGLTAIMSRAFDSELYRVPSLIRPATYGTAVIIALAATAVSAALVRARVDRLDMIRVLKTRE